MRTFNGFEDWIAAVVRRPASCGLAGALLSFVSVVAATLAGMLLFWGIDTGGGRVGYLAALPVLLLGMGFFYLSAPLFWRLEQRLAKHRKIITAETVDPIRTEDPQVAASDVNIDRAPDPTGKDDRRAEVGTSFVFDPTPIPDVSPHKLADLLRDAEAQAAIRPFRSPIVGGLLVFVGLALVIFGFVAAIRADWDGVTMIVVFVPLFLGAAWLVGVGRRIAQLSAIDSLIGDTRAPITYLRSFEEEGAMKAFFGIDDQPTNAGIALLEVLYMLAGRRATSMEVELARVLSAYGPFIAIGQPGERVPHAGASRVYVGHDDWRGVITTAMRESQVVIWQAGTTPGIFWELAAIVEICSPRHVVLLMPNPWLKADEFERVRIRANSILPQPIAASQDDYNFIVFDEAWTPRGVKFQYQPSLLQTFLPSNLDLKGTLDAFIPRQSGGVARRRISPSIVATACLLLVCVVVGLTYPFDKDSVSEFEELENKHQALLFDQTQTNSADVLDTVTGLLSGTEAGYSWCTEHSLRVYEWAPGFVWCARWRRALEASIPGLMQKLESDTNSSIGDASYAQLRSLHMLAEDESLSRYQVSTRALGRSLEHRVVAGKWLGSISWSESVPESFRSTLGTFHTLPALHDALSFESEIAWNDELMFLPKDVAIWSAEERDALVGVVLVAIDVESIEYEEVVQGLTQPPLIVAMNLEVTVQQTGIPSRLLNANCDSAPPEQIGYVELMSQYSRVNALLETCVARLE